VHAHKSSIRETKDCGANRFLHTLARGGYVMRSRRWAPIAAVVIAVLFTAASQAQAQAVTFIQIKDAVPGKFFDATKSRLDPANPNHLIIGFDSGFDPVTLVSNAFSVSPLAFSNRRAMDTLSFVLKAPAGFYIGTVTYTQHGAGSTGRTDVEWGGATWMVARDPHVLGTFSSNPNLTQTVDVSKFRLTSPPVVITLSLFSQTGSLAITSADVLVTLHRF